MWGRTTSWLLKSLMILSFCNVGEEYHLQKERTPTLAIRCCLTFSGAQHCWFKEWGKAGGQVFYSHLPE